MSESAGSYKEQESGSRPQRDRRRVSLLAVMPVRLTKKLAERIDGIDLSKRRVGERLALAAAEAKLLLLEGWAELVPPSECRTQPSRSSSAGSSFR